MMRTASLGMYDSPALHGANDRLWQSIAGHLRDAGFEDIPDRLDRARPLHAIWDDPALLLAQTCGYPLSTQWRGRLRYVATPRYQAPGCDGVLHRSRVVVRREDVGETLLAYRGRRVAINDRQSNTGMNLLRALIAPLAEGQAFFSAVAETGSHAASARLVAEGGADIAAIDTVTYAHLQNEAPDTTRALRTLVWTDEAPGLPFVTSRATPPRLLLHLRRAIRLAIGGAARADADRLLLNDIDVIDPRRYDLARSVERRSVRAGYPHLA